MFNLILACILLVVWAITERDFYLTLAWFNLAIGAVLHISDAVRGRR